MKLALNSEEQRDFAGVVRTLLTPPDPGEVDAWRVTVLTGAQRLFRADKASMHLPLEGITSHISLGIPPREQGNFFRAFKPLEQSWGLLERKLALGAFCRAQLFGRHLRALYRTEYYNEYIVPNRLYDAVEMVTPLGPVSGDESLANLWLHHDRPSGPRFGERGVAMLRLLHPSFVAGVEACRRRAAETAGLAGILDTLHEGVLVADRNGKVLHANRALLRVTMEDPEGQQVLDAMHRLAIRLCAILRCPGDVAGVAAGGKMAQTVATVRGTYRIRGSLLGGEMLGSGAAVMVNMEALSVPTTPSAADLVEQYRFTLAQARVALLIAEGKSDKAIARCLGISPNTVRHHTEQVRLKLGVSSRTEVAHRLLSN